MDLSIAPLIKTPEVVMSYCKDSDKINVICPQCQKGDWQILDIRKPLANWSSLSICKNCGFITFNPQLKNMQDFYAKEIKLNSLNFLKTKAFKLSKHEHLIFKFLRENNISPENVLDYGASDGYLMKEFKNKYPNVNIKGLELNKGHANWAKYIENLDVTLSSDLNQFNEKEFDLIVLYHVLEHIQSPNIFLEEIKKKLKPNGLIYLALPTLNRIDYPNIEQLFKDEHINFWTDNSLEHFFNLAGFEKVFFDNIQYGTCMIFKYTVDLVVERPKNFYIENMQLLNNIYECFKNKSLMMQSLQAKTHDREAGKAFGLKALEYYSNYPELIIQTASLLDPTDEIDFVEDYFKRLPHLKELALQLGLLYYKEPDYEKSEYYLKLALKEFGELVQALAHLAFIEYQKGNIMEAINYIKIIINKNPYDLGNLEILFSLVAKL